MGLAKRAIAAVFDFLQSIVVVMALLVMVYLFIVSPQQISGESMLPNFKDGEYILTSKIDYKVHDPSHGDVIVFKAPSNKEIDYIKRVIGTPGDKIRLANGHYFRNEIQLPETYLPSDIQTFPGSYLQEGIEITVPPGYYFVSGDNRPHSLDSREFGLISKADIIGKAILRYYPFDQFGLIKNPENNSTL